MKLRVAGLAAVLAFATAAAATAKEGSGGLAIGAFLGEPTGITVRYGLSAGQSIEGKAAWSLADSKAGSPTFTFQGNWLLEFPGVLVIKGQDFPLYVGAGGQVDLASGGDRVGFRIPAGVVYRFKEAPLELCLEIGLGMQLFPATSFVGSGGLGVRYRF